MNQRTTSPLLLLPRNTSPPSINHTQTVKNEFRRKYTTTDAMIHGDCVASQPRYRSA